MKHAGDAALDSLEELLQRLRGFGQLQEKKRGTFYRGRTAFLHFHEGPEGLFADVKVGASYRRYRVGSQAERRAVCKIIEEQLRRS